MKQYKRAGLLVLALSFVLGFGNRSAHSASVAPSPAQQTYARAWQLVRQSYYDPSFNGQNWDSWQHKFDGQLSSPEQASTAIKQMLASLNDQYTRYLDPKAFKEEDDAISSIVCGIGVSLRPFRETHALVVNEVVDTSPAKRAGIAYGDKIEAIDGQPTAGFDTDKAAERIRGKAGTAVELTINTHGQVRNVSLIRQRIIVPAVTAKILPHNIGYIKLSTFMADDASAEFKAALEALSRTDALVIDLRDNPGGLLANAIEIADMLLPNGDIVSTVSRKGKVTDSTSGHFMTDAPIAVLVDGDSASASEILAGALKDNHRAEIVGTRTFGKGLVQEISRLPGGSGLHITVARYFTPEGHDINKVGIAPDVEVSERDAQLDTASKLLTTKIAERDSEKILTVGPKHTRPLPESTGGGLRFVSPRS